MKQYPPVTPKTPNHLLNNTVERQQAIPAQMEFIKNGSCLWQRKSVAHELTNGFIYKDIINKIMGT